MASALQLVILLPLLSHSSIFLTTAWTATLSRKPIRVASRVSRGQSPSASVIEVHGNPGEPKRARKRRGTQPGDSDRWLHGPTAKLRTLFLSCLVLANVQVSTSPFFSYSPILLQEKRFCSAANLTVKRAVCQISFSQTYRCITQLLSTCRFAFKIDCSFPR